MRWSDEKQESSLENKRQDEVTQRFSDRVLQARLIRI